MILLKIDLNYKSDELNNTQIFDDINHLYKWIDENKKIVKYEIIEDIFIFYDSYFNKYTGQINFDYKEETIDNFNIDDSKFKIYKYLNDDSKINYKNPWITPKSIDYIKDINVKFNRNDIFKKGLLTEVIYYDKTINNSIIKIDINYKIEDGKIVSRETIRRWYMENGILSDDSKITIKNYNSLNIKNVEHIRRINILNNLEIFLKKELNNYENEIDFLFNVFDEEISKYIKGNFSPLILKFQNIDYIKYYWLLNYNEIIEEKLLDCFI